MATRTVGPTSTFPTIAAAIAAAQPGDTIQLENGYTEGGTVAVTVDGLSFAGDTTNAGIHLALANSINTITLLGTAPFQVDDNADGNTINGNAGDNVIQVGGTTGSTVTDHVDGGAGRDRLIVDYHTTSDNIANDLAASGSLSGGYSGDLSRPGIVQIVSSTGFEDFTVSTGSGNDTIQTGDGNDVISSGGGTDSINTRKGVDQVDGGTGTDNWLADMSAAVAGENISINLNNASSTFTVGGVTGSVTGIEALGGFGGNTFKTGAGDDTIVTHADLNLEDDIATGDGDDTVTVGGTTGANVTDHVDGGSGRDRLIVDYHTATDDLSGDLANPGNLAGGYSGSMSRPGTQLVALSNFEDFTVTTGSGNDRIETGDGNDAISSGDGTDSINTRKGVDQVDGGTGNDNWLADMSAAVAGENISINLNNTNSTFTVGGVTGSVTGIEALGGFGGNTFKTGAGDDTIVTRADLNLEDDIATGDGDDTVTVGGTTGATATDHVDGGSGRDRLIVDYHTATDDLSGDLANPGDLAGGYSGSMSRPGTLLVASSNFEDFTVTTGSGNDTIQTGDGNDVISLGDGTDSINTRKGVDQVDGGTGNDNWLADMSAAVAGENISINLNNTSSSFTVGGVTGSVTGIEALGGFGGNTFKTGAGDDTIVTRADLNLEDDIATGDGNDTVTVGGTTGANVTDHVDGGSGRDRLIVDYQTTSDDIANNLATSGSLAGGYSGDLSRPGVIQVVSSVGFEDFTVKTGSGSDTVTTGDGDDVLSLGTGNDVAHAAGGTDRLVVDYSATSNAITVNGLTGSVGAGYSGSITDGTTAFTVTFDGIENFTIAGGSGNDSITTGDGDDVLRGGVGVDALHGAGGNDTLVAATGDIASGDVFDGGGGTDTLQVTGTVDFTGTTLTSIEALSFATSGESTAIFGFAAALQLPNALAVAGDANINHIVVDTAGDDFSGWTFSNWTNGQDTITFSGAAGGDLIVGTSQNDKIETFGSNDTVTGGGGDDDIDGGANIDTANFTGARAEYSASAGPGGSIVITDSVNARDGSDTLRNIEFVHFSDGTFAINTPPTLAPIPTNVSTERSFAILDSTASASDAQLDALNSGNGDYSGASLTISRHLGANADDDFGFDTSGASFTVSTNALQAGGQTFATFTNTGGTLTITFTGSGTTPTTALANDVLQHITYANENHNPPASVTLDWSFSDGETADFGGALVAAQSQVVNITGVNDAPANTVPGAQTVAEDGTLTITGLAVSDADSSIGNITTTLSVAHGTVTVAAGAPGGLDSGHISGSGTGTVTLTGTAAQINATLAAANSVLYTPTGDFNGSDTLTVTTNDNFHSGVNTANLIFNGDAEAGIDGGAPAGWTTTAGGPEVHDYASNFALTTADSNTVGGGANYFTGGNNQALSTAEQIVDVSTYTSQIDAGEATANLSGYFGGWLGQGDNATLTAHFLDGSSNDLGSFTVGGVSPADRGSITELLFREGSLLVPVGTRSIKLDLTSTQSVQSFNDGYADNLSLTLTFAEKDTDTVAIGVSAVNDAPVASGSATLTAISEDATNPSGATIGSLFGSNFSDATDQVSGGSTANVLAGIAISGNAASAAEGAWQWSSDGTTWHDVTGVSNSAALVLTSATELRFVPTTNWNGTTPALTAHLIDDSAAITNNTTVNLASTGTGGMTPYSSGTVALTETVNTVNDAPVASGSATLTAIDEDATNPAGATIGSLFGGNFSDATDQVTGGSTANTFAGIAISANAATATEGKWQWFDGSAWQDIATSVSESAALVLAAATKLRFLPGTDWNGATPALTAHLIDSSAAITNDTTVNLTTAGTGGTTQYSSATVALTETINALNDVVIASAPASVSLAEDDSAPITGLSIADVDTTLAPNGVYTVTLSASHGALTLSTTTGLTFTGGSDGAADATMTFHGTLAAINTALATASYAGAANYNGSDTIAFTVTDTDGTTVATGSGSATTDSKSIAVMVTAANDPVTAAASSTFTIAEDAAPATVTGLAIADVDATLAPNGVYEVTLSASHGVLTLTTRTGLTFTNNDGVADATMTFHGTFSAINTALSTAAYTGDANFNGADTIAFSVTDDFGGTIATGTGSATSNSENVAVTVTAVNDAPVASGSATLTAINEDATNPAGATITSLFGGNFSDATDQVAGGSSANTLTGIAISANAATAASGAWQWFDGSVWVNIATSVSDTSALVLAAATQVRFLPAADWNGTTPALTAHLIDSSAAVTNNTTVNLTSTGTGGITQYSSGTVALTETLNAANDAPVASGSATLTAINEDATNPSGATIGSLFGGNFSDAADQVSGGSSANTLAGVAISGDAATATEGAWEWSSDGTIWHAITGVSNSAALVLTTATQLRFAPAADWNGTTPALTAHLIDSSAAITNDTSVDLTSTGTGGTTQYSAGTVALTATINAVSDTVATSAPGVESLIEDGSVNIAGLAVADVDATLAPNGVYQVTLAANHGTLTLSTVTGLTFTAGDGTADSTLTFHGTLAAINAALATASYKGAADYNGSDAISFSATDSFGSVVATGSGSASADSKSIAVSVSAVNDAPVVSGSATLTAVNEDTAAPPGATITSLFGGSFSDAADQVSGGSSANNLAGIAISGNAATATEGKWQWFDGSAWQDIAGVSASSALVLVAATQLRFLPATNWNGTAPALTAHLIDDSAAITNNTTVNLTSTGTGGTTQYSAGTVALTEAVNPVNDPVTATAPATAAASEDTPLAITGLSIADIDAALTPNGVYEVTLAAGHGALTLSTLTGLTFTAGDGAADATMTFHGTLAAINAGLATASYEGAANYNGADTIAFSVTDSFNSVVATGSGSASSDSNSIAVTVSAVSDPVTAAAPATATVAEDTSAAIAGLSIADVDTALAPSGVYQVTLSAGHGTLSMSTLSGLTFTAGDGTADASMTFHGTLSSINAGLATARYAGATNYNGTDTIAFSVTDGFNSVVATGTGPAASDSKNLAVIVTPVNDPVTASAPATASLAEDSSVAIGGLSIADLDTALSPNGVYEVTLSAGHGALSMSALSGLTFTAGDGSADASMTFHGTLAAINAGLATASYAGAADYNGADAIAFSVTDSFNGVAATGSGGATTAAKSVAVTISAVNDAPVNTVATTQVAGADGSVAISGLSIADPDAGSGTVTTTFSVEHGTLTVASAGGAAVSGSGTATVTLTGSQAQINTTLGAANNVVYTPTHDFFGADTLTMTTSDNGNTGAGGVLTDTDTLTLNVNTIHVSGTDGDNSFTSLDGNERIDAGYGVDTVTFGFKLVDATVSYAGSTVVIDGPGGSHTVLTGVEKFVFADGTVDNNDGDVLVDDLFYYAKYHDVWSAHVDADAHYHQAGWEEGRDPDAFFSTDIYLSANPDVKAAGVDPLLHFDQFGWKEGRVPSLGFDLRQYLDANPDVKAAQIDPLAHFLQFGTSEGRQSFAPTELIAANGFDYVYYLQNNPDVKATGVDPFLHFETFGWKEGRNPNALFDTDGYLAAYADVKNLGVNPLDHYHDFGWKEGRDPSVGFDTTDYLGHYADVAAANIDPLGHFLQFGIHEGRSAFADGVWG